MGEVRGREEEVRPAPCTLRSASRARTPSPAPRVLPASGPAAPRAHRRHRGDVKWGRRSGTRAGAGPAISGLRSIGPGWAGGGGGAMGVRTPPSCAPQRLPPASSPLSALPGPTVLSPLSLVLHLSPPLSHCLSCSPPLPPPSEGGASLLPPRQCCGCASPSSLGVPAPVPALFLCWGRRGGRERGVGWVGAVFSRPCRRPLRARWRLGSRWARSAL